MLCLPIARKTSVCLWSVMFVATAGLLASPVTASEEAENGVSYTKDIAPILERSCQQCHRPESVAPMSLLTYEQARPWARAMKYRTGRVGKPDVMPPWYIEKDIGIQHYKGDVSLSADEIAAIAEWADNGAPRGETVEETVAAEAADSSGWEIGEPHLVLTSPEIEVSPTAPDWWGPMGETETGLTEDRYVSAIEMREVNTFEGPPERDTIGGLYVIHHLVISPVGPDGKPVADAGFWPVHEVGRNADVFHPDSASCCRRVRRLRSPPPTCTRTAATRGRTWRSASSSTPRATSRRARCRSSGRRRSTSTSSRCRPTRSSRPSAR